jgi:hypothetical protein
LQDKSFGKDGLMPNTKLFLNNGLFIGVRPDDEDLTEVKEVLRSVFK